MHSCCLPADVSHGYQILYIHSPQYQQEAVPHRSATPGEDAGPRETGVFLLSALCVNYDGALVGILVLLLLLQELFQQASR